MNRINTFFLRSFAMMKIHITRKHSNRMRTARLLTVGVCVRWCVCPGECAHPADPEAHPSRPRGRHPPLDRITETDEKALLCPKLRLRVVNMLSRIYFHLLCLTLPLIPTLQSSVEYQLTAEVPSRSCDVLSRIKSLK